MTKLPEQYYQQPDVLAAARGLIGKIIYTRLDGLLTAGRKVETEAYSGACDKACHAYPYKRTARTEVFYAKGGKAYVYLCYGIHHLFNIVTNRAGEPDAVLVRSIEPLVGIDVMMQRRKLDAVSYRLTAGPGLLSAALGISKQLNGLSLMGDTIWLADDGYLPREIMASPRVGVDFAEEHADLPWRFRLSNSQWTSKAK